MNIDDPRHCHTHTDENESTDGEQEDTPAMEHTHTQEEEDEEDNFITKLCQDLPELTPRNRTPDRVPPNQLEVPRTFAASSATKAKETVAKEGKHANGSTPVKVPKRVWCPKVRMVYQEPEETLDTSGNLDWLFEEHGEGGIQHKKELPPRDDIIKYDPEIHAKEIDNNVQWRGCPPEHRIALRAIIEKFFDVFAQEGIQCHICGFEFNIETGTVQAHLLQTTSMRTSRKSSHLGTSGEIGTERHHRGRQWPMGISGGFGIESRSSTRALVRVCISFVHLVQNA
jgi:hypothetical protein